MRRNGGSSSVTYSNVAEFGLYDENDINIAISLYESATANSYSTLPSNAFDNNINTIWESDFSGSPSTTNWLQIKLLSAQKIVKFSITPRNSSSYHDFLAAFKLQGSNDGNLWTDLYSVSDLTSGWNIGVAREFLLPADLKYLIKESTHFYNVVDGELNLLSITELTANNFETFGNDEPPNAELISQLSNPTVYAWNNLRETPLNAKLYAVPPTQTLGVQIDMSHDSIRGIRSATANYAGNIGISYSLDDGETYSEEETMYEFLNEDFDSIFDNLPQDKKLYMKIYIHEDSYLTNLIINYNNI